MPYEQLSKEERAVIYELSREGLSQADISRHLCRKRPMSDMLDLRQPVHPARAAQPASGRSAAGRGSTGCGV